MENDCIYLSIKPNFVALIASGEKNHEFRKYIPKRVFKNVIVYTTTPVAEIRYILEIDNITKYPDKIQSKGVGNEEFSSGKKRSNYAYRIARVWKLKQEIPLNVLKQDFGFCPPQRFLYGNANKELTDFILAAEKVRVL